MQGLQKATSNADSEVVVLGNKYEVSRTALGQGAFGAVVIGTDKLSESELAAGMIPERYAIKKIPIAVMVSLPLDPVCRL